MTSLPEEESRAPHGPSEMLGDSDWDDEDLLTIAEASERLAQEVARSRTRARMLHDLLESGDVLDGDRAGLVAQAEAETARADELAAAAERIRAGRANAPVPR
ncbi:hypothetical protein [Nocardioides marmoriginsengisoli]|uniref:hypothetical protein n=1 Tax=Nocardioides marmoriginsengisoli TaxID=661483 RepID=UPI001619BFA4|nr:hypothetical protein [Nocardioides marmoriginsengisoli]